MKIWSGAHDAAFERVQTELAAAYLTDGLPLVPPTMDRVAAMLAANGYAADEEISMLPPGFETATAGDIAICAVMAGCLPAYLPVLIAAVDALSDMSFNLVGIGTTTGSAAPVYIVNGPIVDQIGLNAKNNALGTGHRANATIGRAIRLLLMNLGGGLAGLASATVFSSPIRYTACLTENVALSPWETLAKSNGYAETDNVITCAMVESPRLHFDDVSTEPERLLRGIGDSMTSTGSWNMWFSSDVVVAMGPQHARLCADAGMSRAQVQQRLWELAERPQGNLKRGGNWRAERARALGIDPNDDGAPFKAVKDVKRVQLIVAGGLGPVTAVCHGWNESSRAVHGAYEATHA